MASSSALAVTVVVVLALVGIGALVLIRAVRRRRQGWYAPSGGATSAEPRSADARGAVNRNSWMLGGGGGGGGG